ncbi:hypothetical protein SRHO_G00294970 [Serrasalmus rhombeus]
MTIRTNRLSDQPECSSGSNELSPPGAKNACSVMQTAEITKYASEPEPSLTSDGAKVGITAEKMKLKTWMMLILQVMRISQRTLCKAVGQELLSHQPQKVQMPQIHMEEPLIGVDRVRGWGIDFLLTGPYNPT